jgi:hypothetical protein
MAYSEILLNRKIFDIKIITVQQQVKCYSIYYSVCYSMYYNIKCNVYNTLY